LKHNHKKTNLAEKIGTALAVFGAILILAGALYKGDTFAFLIDRAQLFFWTGLLIWSFGYLKTQQDQKKNKDQAKGEEPSAN
jgi:hypothetical protein